jgi:hypothetical protein
VFSTSQTAVAFGMRGASCMTKSPLKPHPPFSDEAPFVINDDWKVAGI